ncbi:hypothetical protein E6O75_ATG09606 [Venturia nashicola]|uniref:Uncharacterized protein n=1 Tax=Venturia nashicola TaxID=86259 RepID=A0A4Z1P872_9PEZI|nr:hypothetical protein E6O75_ATG09606 [Venturia nashicola]
MTAGQSKKKSTAGNPACIIVPACAHNPFQAHLLRGSMLYEPLSFADRMLAVPANRTTQRLVEHVFLDRMSCGVAKGLAARLGVEFDWVAIEFLDADDVAPRGQLAWVAVHIVAERTRTSVFGFSDLSLIYLISAIMRSPSRCDPPW